MPPPSPDPMHIPSPHTAWLSMGDIFHNLLGNFNFPFPLRACLLLLAGCYLLPTEMPTGGAQPMLVTNLCCGVTKLLKCFLGGWHQVGAKNGSA